MSIIVNCPSCGAKNRIPEHSKGIAICGKCKRRLPEPDKGVPIELTDYNFDNAVNNSDKPVLVDFWADWCMPCRMMTPILEQLGMKYHSIQVAKLNTETCQSISMRHQIQSIPTLILFINGREIKRIIGARTLPALEAELREWL